MFKWFYYLILFYIFALTITVIDNGVLFHFWWRHKIILYLLYIMVIVFHLCVVHICDCAFQLCFDENNSDVALILSVEGVWEGATVIIPYLLVGVCPPQRRYRTQFTANLAKKKKRKEEK